MGETTRRRRRGRVVPAAGLVVALLAATGAGLGPAAAQEEPTAPPSPSTGAPDDDKTGLTDSRLRDAVAAVGAGADPTGDVVADGDSLVVEVLYNDEAGARAAVAAAGGTVNGAVAGWLLQALVPADALEALEADPAVDSLRVPGVSAPIEDPPAPPAGPGQAVAGVHITESNADAWQAAGIDGSSVQIGVVDFFTQTLWNNAVASGDLPAPSGTFCQSNGVACSVWGSSTHGNNVAEIIHDMVPGADIYIATVSTVSDLQAAVNYFDAQGVDVISRSLTDRYDGPGDGTGPLAAVMDDAVAKGMAWFNSAGNNAGATGSGSYWRGTYQDTDGDGWLDMAGGDELLQFSCGYINGVRWSDWGSSNPTDYDVYVYNDPGRTQLLGSSRITQGPGVNPLEPITACNDTADYLAIYKWADGDGPTGDVIEFMTNGRPVEASSNPYSASGPASDTANPGAMSVGAIDPATGNTIASYSAWGPTNDNRIKPDMSAQACLATSLTSCFNGTSSSTPVMAGAAALLLDSGVATTPSAVVSWLRTNAAADRGTAGNDNVYGAGELLLPDPPLCPLDDAHEDNDTRATATPLTAGIALDGVTCDDDWFSLPVKVGETVTADATFSHAGGDVDIALYDPAGTFVASSTSVTDNESVSHFATTTGTYAVRVYGYNGAQNSYSIEMNRSACPPDDPFENNDTRATATALAFGSPVTGRACPSDDDWYSFTLAAGQHVVATTDFAHADGDVDIQLYDPSGVARAASTSVSDDESLSHIAATAGTWSVRVYGFNGAQNGYTLTVTTPPAPRVRAFGTVATEGDAGTTTANAVILLESAPGVPYVAQAPITVHYFTGDVPGNPRVAHPGEDFVATSGYATIPAGASQVTFPISVIGDTVDEPPLLYGEWGIFAIDDVVGDNAVVDISTFFGLGLLIIIDDDP